MSDPKDRPVDASDCPDCGGTGKGGDRWWQVNGGTKPDPNDPCDYCNGKGWVKWS